jgi:hypothetical protein
VVRRGQPRQSAHADNTFVEYGKRHCQRPVRMPGMTVDDLWKSVDFFDRKPHREQSRLTLLTML